MVEVSLLSELRSVQRLARQVARPIEATKNLPQGRVVYLTEIIARGQVPLCDVGGVRRAIHHDVIPGLVLGWATEGHLFIPLLGQTELGVHGVDHATVTNLDVIDDLADVELRGLHGRILVTSRSRWLGRLWTDLRLGFQRRFARPTTLRCLSVRDEDLVAAIDLL